MFLYLTLRSLGYAAIEGEVRLTGLHSTRAGRIEVFLNGKWGSVNTRLDESDKKKQLAYGKTVCFQINKYFGGDATIYTGTVNSVNELLEDAGEETIVTNGLTSHISMYDVDCNMTGGIPEHILRCSYKKPDGSRKDSGNDLAVVCEANAEEFHQSYIGQIRLVSKEDVNEGILEIYAGSYWGNVCSKDFDQNSANTACRQLGYTNAKDFSAVSTDDSPSGYTVWLSSVSCGENNTNLCLWNCLSYFKANLFYRNISTICSSKSYVEVNCEFEVDKVDRTVAPYIGNACQLPPLKPSILLWIVFIGVLLAVVLVVLVVIAAIVVGCCCLSACCRCALNCCEATLNCCRSTFCCQGYTRVV